MMRRLFPSGNEQAEPPVFPDGTAAVLAGGKSSRLGRPKALVTVRDGTLLERAVALAQVLSGRVLLVLAHKDQISAPPQGTEVLADRIPDCGPLGGIYTALTACKTPWLAVLPCDMPFLSPAVYRFLFQNISPGRVAVARSHRGVEPLVSIWPKEAEGWVEEELRSGKKALWRLLRKSRAVSVDLPAGLSGYRKEWFFNLNTPADLHALHRLLPPGR